MKNYTILAYQSSGTDSVMGCVQSRWDSDFEISSFPEDQIDDAVNCWVNYLDVDERRRDPHGYPGPDWELYVLVDGEEVDCPVFEAKLAEALKEREEEKARKAAEEAKIKKAEKARKAAEAAVKKEQQELEMLAKLKEKYEGDP